MDMYLHVDETAPISGSLRADGYNSVLLKADGLPISQALPLYVQLSKLLSDQVADIPL